MANPFYVFLQQLQELPEPLDKEVVKDLLIEHFEGRRVFFSYRPDKHGRQDLADKLIRRGFKKADAVQILIQNFSISKTWAYSLVNNSINSNFHKKVAEDRKRLTEIAKEKM